MKRMQNLKSRLLGRQGRKGQTMTEYAIIVALIALVCIGAITTLGERISGIFTDAGNELEGDSSSE